MPGYSKLNKQKLLEGQRMMKCTDCGYWQFFTPSQLSRRGRTPCPECGNIFWEARYKVKQKKMDEISQVAREKKRI